MHEPYRLGGRSAGERLKETDDLPALDLGELWLSSIRVDRRPRRHRGEWDPVAYPVEELAGRVLRDVHLEVVRRRLQRERGRSVASALRAVADRAVCLVERAAEGDGAGVVRRRVLREPRREWHGWRRDVRRDRVPDRERDDDEYAKGSRALREALRFAGSAPSEQ